MRRAAANRVAVRAPRRKEAAVKRTIVIEINDTASPKDLQSKPEKGLKRILRLIADQVAWGDESRPIVDKQGNTVGRWTLTKE
jgi:hypothetical protein